MVISITEDDTAFISKNYPELTISSSKIEGIFNFTANNEKLGKISDSFHLLIKLESREGSILPKVSNLWGRLIRISKKYNKNLEDIHINPDNTFCFMTDTEEKEYFEDWIFNFRVFFFEILIPYLYGISFYEKKWFFPWGERAHWFLWYLESYNEWKTSIEELIKRDQEKIIARNIWIKWHRNCLCWSGKKIKVCHKEILEAFYKLRSLKKKTIQ